MRAKVLLPTVLALLTGYLSLDLVAFWQQLNRTPAGGTVALTVFDGAWKIAEQIPRNQAPMWLAGFLAVIAALFVLAMLGFRQARK